MPRKFLRRFMPDIHKLNEYGVLKPFGKLAHNTNLWHLNRRSAAGGFAVGVFFAFMPVPFQMLLAAAAAILFAVNLPLAVALVWISNPLTLTPMLYASYRIGSFLLNRSPHPFHFELSWAWFESSIYTVVPPLLLGSLVLGSFAAAITYVLVRRIWRQAVQAAWNERIKLRKARFLKLKEELIERQKRLKDQDD
ncbi:DUF2062 domain-containing protein [Aliidiomarina shirensis]|uniref:DUF2062 domain-containing protein n=2 Tax=Aliidiomarina shirensis TaxID=1048642 RepID=A0A432WWL1_9GAMM|nr:DUF2062 domain-containing protein [Aliidiomarina shirensis]